MAPTPGTNKECGMNIEITLTGDVEINGQPHDPLNARHHALRLLEAADQALTQQARNFSFTTKQRTTP